MRDIADLASGRTGLFERQPLHTAVERQHRGGEPARSQHLSYPFELSARDMARIGELMLDHGTWAGQQLVPRDWAQTITTPVTFSADMHPAHAVHHGVDYGYLWWVSKEPPDRCSDASA